MIAHSFEEILDYHICGLKSIYELIPCLFEVPNVLTSINWLSFMHNKMLTFVLTSFKSHLGWLMGVVGLALSPSTYSQSAYCLKKIPHGFSRFESLYHWTYL